MEKKRNKIIAYFAMTLLMLLISNISTGSIQWSTLFAGLTFQVLTIAEIMRNWRCPRCDKFLGKITIKTLPTECKECGKKL